MRDKRVQRKGDDTDKNNPHATVFGLIPIGFTIPVLSNHKVHPRRADGNRVYGRARPALGVTILLAVVVGVCLISVSRSIPQQAPECFPPLMSQANLA